MDINLHGYSEEESRKYNGQTVVSVLSRLGDAATAEKISDEIVYMVNQPNEVVKPEVKRILRRGISNGFLEKFGKNYLLSGVGDIVEVDSRPTTSHKNTNRRVPKRKRSTKPIESSDSDQEGYLSVKKRIALKFDETDSVEKDSVEKDNQMVLLNPRKAINGIINDLYKMVQSSEEASDDQDYVIDLEDIIKRNINRVSKPSNNDKVK